MLLPLSILYCLLWSHQGSEAARKGCGGTFTAARGILQTPNFPGPFPVPLNCEWIIDSQHMASPNTSIVVYLTQLFVFEGLTFTEYQLYGSDYKIHPRLVHKVNETNISKLKWVQTFQSFLVIQLKLPSAESAHLRVLDQFLEVFGFNITYEITTGSVRPNSCTMMDCGFTGVCYDHYNKFVCDCFTGHSGPHCSDGSKSFCNSSGSPICRNGGTCVHVGVSAVRCHCPKNYTGSTCEVQETAQKDCKTCKVSCHFDGKLENACKCTGMRRNYSSDDISGDRLSGFATTLQLSPILPTMEESNLKVYMQEQLLGNLQHDFPKVEDVTVTSITQVPKGIDVAFRVFGPKDEKRLRSILNRWKDRGYFGNISISDEEKGYASKSTVTLQSLTINQPGVIRENDEFILSCVARGPPTINFRWFKDGILVNVSATRNRKWTKVIRDPHIADQYTALLAVTNAHPLDRGLFQCQTEVGDGWQQCASLRVVVSRPPGLKVEPLAATVKKGDNFTIKCVNVDDAGLGSKYTYSWTKNKELLPVKTENERYEVLYPSGTILQVRKAERDADYSCLVQDGVTAAATSERTVSIKVIGRHSMVPTCSSSEAIGGATWPETAPDTECLLDCPEGYTGIATRYCSLWDSTKPRWRKPNYSGCLHRQLESLFNEFQQYQLGYMTKDPETVLSGFLDYLTRNESDKLLPGEGVRVLTLTQNILDYLGKSKLSIRASKTVTKTVLSIIDNVLMVPKSIVKSTDLRTLLELMDNLFDTMSEHLLQEEKSQAFRLSLNTVHLSLLNLTTENMRNDYFHIPNYFSPQPSDNNWLSIQFSGTNNKNQRIEPPKLVAGVIFRNLTRFLPPRSFLRIKDGSELEYEIYSQIITVFTRPKNLDMYPIAVDFKHELHHKLNWSNEDTWSVKCGFADASTFAYTWDIYSCYTEILTSSKTRCICPKSGTYALLLTLTPPKAADGESNPHRYIVVIGCSLCMIFALFTTACLATSFWLLRGSCILILKLQCSVSIFVIGLFFTLATLTNPPQKYFMLFITSLETFFLLGTSSHLSKLLIVFTELTPLPKPMTSMYTVVGIVSGVPVITVFGSHLSYRTMDIKLESWWMLSGSLAFNIFICVLSVIVLLFVFIYIVVMKKLKELRIIHESYKKPIMKRMVLLQRSGFTFTAVVVFAISSLIYINTPNQLWSVCQFSCSNVLVGLILIFCYVAKSETQFQQMFKNKQKANANDKFFGFESTSSPLNFLTKQEAEVENDSSPHIKQDFQLYSSCGLEASKQPNASKSQSTIVTTIESRLHTGTSFCDPQACLGSPERRDSSHLQQNLESYNSSPLMFRKLPGGGQSPDILSNKVCVDLDLIASSLKSSNKNHQQLASEARKHVTFPSKEIFVPDEAIARILEPDSALLKKGKEISRTSDERSQPDGHDERVLTEMRIQPPDNICTVIPEEDEPTTPTILRAAPEITILEEPPPTSSGTGDKLDGMLDSITHDLDFLLNRSNEVDVAVQTSSLRRVSKLPGKSVKHKISEEPETEDLPASVTMRTNC